MLPLPALRGERVGVRGALRGLSSWTAPLTRRFAPTSPRKRGEVEPAARLRFQLRLRIISRVAPLNDDLARGSLITAGCLRHRSANTPGTAGDGTAAAGLGALAVGVRAQAPQSQPAGDRIEDRGQRGILRRARLQRFGGIDFCFLSRL